MKSMSTFSCEKGTPHLPAAAATRPQLASWPKMAVLTSGELAMAKATLSASACEAAPRTSTVTSLVDPSPSAAIWRARLVQTPLMAATTAGKAGDASSMTSPPAAPVAKRMHVSLVEVSESTVTLLKVWRTAERSAAYAASGVSGASVESTQSMVAMLGWIMPEPFTKPPTCTVTELLSAWGAGPAKAASLGWVSVVMTAQAASWAASGVAASASTMAGTPFTYGSKGSCTPMTPVEATSTSCSSQLSTWATRAQAFSAHRRPGSPVAALALPELRTTARA